MADEAARIDDPHTCPAPKHAGGPIQSGSGDVEINDKPAARATDAALCAGVGAKDMIVTGSALVTINDKPAARAGDRTMHAQGTVTAGSDNVEIGGWGGGVTVGSPEKDKERCAKAREGRDGRSTQRYNNCGVEAMRSIINEAKGGSLGEEALFRKALDIGAAETVHDWFWKFGPTNDRLSGGTFAEDWPSVGAAEGVGMHLEEPTLTNLTNALAEGRGVVTAHETNLLYGGGPSELGHAIRVTGVRFNERGGVDGFYFIDSAADYCSSYVDSVKFFESRGADKAGTMFKMAVTNAPLPR
jgi:uncharacterized Zn-binding protein involved in type VI secretion